MRMRLSRVPGLCAPLTVLGLLLGCGAPPPPSFPEEDQLLESLIEEYVLARFRFYPVESTLAGLPGNDDRLGSFSAADVGKRIGALSDFHKKLLGLRPEALSQTAYLDALWLTSLVKMELFDLEERKVLDAMGEKITGFAEASDEMYTVVRDGMKKSGEFIKGPPPAGARQPAATRS